MNIVDIIVIIVILVFTIRGYLKGFVNEVFSIVIIFGSLVTAFILYRPVSGAITDFIENNDLRMFLSFTGVFVITALFLIIMRNFIIGLLDNLNLTDIDSLLGMLTGFLKGGFICMFLLMFLVYRNVLKSADLINGSLLFPYFEKSYRILISIFPPVISNVVNKFIGIT